MQRPPRKSNTQKRNHGFSIIIIILLLLTVIFLTGILAVQYIRAGEEKMRANTPAAVQEPVQEPAQQYAPEDNSACADTEEEEKLIEVPAICQYPSLPTGCEAVAATMVLQYYNENITAEEFAAAWLSCNKNFYWVDNRQYGPDPNVWFAGDPFSKNSFGCYSAAITSAINGSGGKCAAEELYNLSLEDICEDYIDENKPILIWATTGMKPSETGATWYLENNAEFTWISGEHCLVLVGYDDDYYFLNDPQSGSVVGYPKEVVNERFYELGAQAVYIYEI